MENKEDVSEEKEESEEGESKADRKHRLKKEAQKRYREKKAKGLVKPPPAWKPGETQEQRTRRLEREGGVRYRAKNRIMLNEKSRQRRAYVKTNLPELHKAKSERRSKYNREWNAANTVDQALRRYKKRAIEEGLGWELEDAEAKGFFLSKCHYCGVDPSPRNGIDRKDNGRGYELDNVVPCCTDCNFSKSAVPYDHFQSYLKGLAECVRRFGSVNGCPSRPDQRIVNNDKREVWIRNHKYSATHRGLSWTLSDEVTIQLIASECRYCGFVPETRSCIGRKDNQSGYDPDNVVSCCRACIAAKRAMPYEDFLVYIDRISDHVLGSHPQKMIEDKQNK